MFVPELKIPVASARSFWGNHSATVLIDAGKLPASPKPSAKRASANPAAAPESVTMEKPAFASRLSIGRCRLGIQSAAPCAIAARLHTTTASANPRRVPIRSMIRPAKINPSAYASEKAKMIDE